MPFLAVVIFFLSFTIISRAENNSQLDSLQYLQKQAVENVESAASWSEDMMALHFLSDKLQNYALLDYYPSKTGQMFSNSFRPRFQISPAFKLNSGAPSLVSLVPIREVFKKKTGPSDPCNQTISPVPFFNGTLDPNLYCLDPAATRTLEVDSTMLTSIQRVSDLRSNGEIQMGYVSVPSSLDSAYFTDPNVRLVQEASKLSARRFEFLRFISLDSEPSRVAFIEVKAGSIVAQIPYPEPSFINPQCQITSNTSSSCRSLFPGATCTQLNSASFNLVNTGGVVISASLDGQSLSESEIPQQTVQQSKNELLKSLSISDLRSRMKNVQQEPGSDYAQGLIEISGQVRGPSTYVAPSLCKGAVAFRFYNPPSPTCQIALSPADQEPDLPVTATVKVKNQTTSAVLVSSANSLSRALNFNPAPSVTQEASTSISLVKQGDTDEIISVTVQGPGGTGTCQAPLRFLRPAPAQCNLTANPSSVSVCNPNTTLTLDCVNRVHWASINGVPVTLNSQGKASIPYTKVGLGSVTVYAEARNRWWREPSKPNATIGDNTVAPSCNLTASASNIMVGQNTNLILSNVQGCFDEKQIDINGTQVALSGGQASLSYKKQNTQTETLIAHMRGPAGVAGTCSVTLTGFPIPKPSCRLTADRTTLATSESTTLRLSFEGEVNPGETYINGYPGTTYTFTKNTNNCGPVTITGYVVGPGGRSNDCPVTIQHNTPIPACDLSVSPNADLLVGASTTASLSCTNGRSVGSAVLLDENKTDDIKSRGVSSKTLSNLSAGTHSVRAIVRDECNTNILDKTITLSVATPPPPCPFMRENHWVTLGLQSNLDFCRRNNATGTGWVGCPSYNFGENLIWGRTTKIYKPYFVVETNLDKTVRNQFYRIRDLGTTTTSTWTSIGVPADPPPQVGVIFQARGTTGFRGTGRVDRVMNTDWTVRKFPYDGGEEDKVYSIAQGHPWDKTIQCKSEDNRICMQNQDLNNPNENYAVFVSIKDTDRSTCSVADVVARDEGGCFTANTPILMADGSEKLITQLQTGDYVLNPHYRMGIRVRKVVKGPEPKPLFEVVLGEQRIHVTEDHPFLTEHGWTQARTLRKGDKLFGEGKGKTVKEVRKLPYQKPVDVWNFELESEDPMAHIVIANGIPTGDLVTQQELKKKASFKASAGFDRNQYYSR